MIVRTIMDCFLGDIVYLVDLEDLNALDRCADLEALEAGRDYGLRVVRGCGG